MADILRPGAFRARLGLGRARFAELQQQGRFRDLEHVKASRALGVRVYDAAKVEAFFADKPESVSARGPKVVTRQPWSRAS